MATFCIDRRHGERNQSQGFSIFHYFSFKISHLSFMSFALRTDARFLPMTNENFQMKNGKSSRLRLPCLRSIQEGRLASALYRSMTKDLSLHHQLIGDLFHSHTDAREWNLC